MPDYSFDVMKVKAIFFPFLFCNAMAGEKRYSTRHEDWQESERERAIVNFLPILTRYCVRDSDAIRHSMVG